MSQKNQNIIIAIIINVIIFADMLLVGLLTIMTHSEYGPNEIMQYYGCGASIKEEIFCVGRSIQKELAHLILQECKIQRIWIIGIISIIIISRYLYHEYKQGKNKK